MRQQLGMARIAVVAVSGLMVPAAMLASDANFDKNLSVSGTPVISVSTGSGFIHITPWSGRTGAGGGACAFKPRLDGRRLG